MSTVIAMIYHGEMCLASDVMSIDHETGLEDNVPAIKQITINENITIGFVGSGTIAQVIMRTLQNPMNEDKVSKATLNDIPMFLDDIYQSYIEGKQFPDEEACHVSALILGLNGETPEIISWDCNGARYRISQDSPENFTAYVLPPYDMNRNECNKILWESAEENLPFVSLKKVAADYFQVVSSRSKFVSDTATIWTLPTLGPINSACII